jgi:serine/threonine-protein kinase
VNPEAYQAYLRGRHHWNSWTSEGFRRAVEHFQRAIDLDATYALAYAGLGDTFGAMAYYGYIDPSEGFTRARAAAERALALDPALADAHVTLALGHLFACWDWTAAGEALERAIALNPKLATARSVKALFLSTCGRFDEALAEAKTGRDLDPLSPFTGMGVAWVHHFAGNRDEAVREALQVRELAPSLEEAGNVLIAAYEGSGRYEEAAGLVSSQRCWGLTLDGQALLDAYRAGGQEAYWRTRVELMSAVSRPFPSAVHYAFAIGHVVLGQIDTALEYLEQMVDAHVGGAVFIGVDPTLRELRGNERYEAILRRVGSPMASAPHTASP